MPSSGYFDVVFGVAGDLSTVPDGVQGDGSVSYTQGFGGDYSLPAGNPARLFVPRTKTNQLFYDITSALQRAQQNGTPPFITTTMNGGTPYSYSLGDQVMSGGVRYISLINSNTDTPPTSNWGTSTPVNLGGIGVSSLTAYAPIFGGTSSTGAVQSGTAGTADLPLVSNGASAIGSYKLLTVAGGGTGLATLTANNVILGNGTSTPSFVAPSTSGNVLVSNGTTWTSAALLGLAKAWVNFNGTGTVAIRSSLNVSSITDNGVGSWRINFASALANANYAPVLGVESASGLTNGLFINILQGGTFSTSAFDITCQTPGGSDTDAAYITAAVFGG